MGWSFTEFFLILVTPTILDNIPFLSLSCLHSPIFFHLSPFHFILYFFMFYLRYPDAGRVFDCDRLFFSTSICRDERFSDTPDSERAHPPNYAYTRAARAILATSSLRMTRFYSLAISHRGRRDFCRAWRRRRRRGYLNYSLRHGKRGFGKFMSDIYYGL